MITHANKFDIRNLNFANMVQRSFIMIAVFFSLISTSWAATTYYVSNSGNDANNGTSLNTPLKTIQRAMGKVAPGDTVFVRGGTYREEVSAYRGGTADNYVTVSGYQNEVPVIKGSEIVTGWTLHGGNIWKKNGWTHNSQQVFVDLKDDAGLQQIGMPSRFYTSFEYPTPVGSGLGSMVAGSFYHDPASSTLYVWLPDGSSPNNHTMEVSTKRRLFFMAASYIKLQRMAFRHTNSSAFTQQGAAVELGSYSIMDQCDVQFTDFAGVTVGYLKTGAQVINSNISNNGDSGVNGPASYNFRIAGNTLNHNNYRKFNPLWHAGGVKITSKGYGVVEYNEVAHNQGSGIWFDYANSGNAIVVKNNYVHDNGPKEAAIFIEVTKNAAVFNNVLVNNERRGVYVSASDNVRVHNNTIEGTKGYASVEVNGMPRSGATLTQNSIYNNTISNSTANYDMLFAASNGTTIMNNTSNYNNLFRSVGALKLSMGGMYSTLDAWQKATKQDLNSLNANPAYVGTAKTAAARYAVTATSPLVNAGMQLGHVADDFLNVARPSGDAYDIGAFEAVNAGPTKDTVAPVIVVASPAQEGAAVSGVTTITATATDNVGVTMMKLYVDGTAKASSTNGQLTYSWDTAGLRLGTHSIWISAVDAKNNIGKVYRNVKVTEATYPEPAPSDSADETDTAETVSPYPVVDESIPAIVLGNSLQDGSVVTGTTTLLARPTEGVNAVLTKIYVDGALKATSDTGEVSYDWNTAGLRKGTHTVWISSVDAKGTITKSYLNIVVQ